MVSLSEISSDVISISITLTYMIIIWVAVNNLKWFSALAGIHKKPLYLVIIFSTVIPLYAILKTLFENKLPINLKIGFQKSGTRQLRQMAGIENRFTLPSDPDNQYKVKDTANKEVDEAAYADPIKGDKVAIDVLNTNYPFGSPKNSQSRFVMHGSICENQDFLKNEVDDDGDAIETVRVKWNLIANQNPRYCRTPGCIKGGNLSEDYGAMKTDNTTMSENAPRFYNDACTTPYMMFPQNKIKQDYIGIEQKDGTVLQSSVDINESMQKQYVTYGKHISVKQCIEACDNYKECAGFLYSTEPKKIEFFGAGVTNDPDGITQDGSAINTTVYVKPPATSMVHLRSLLQPSRLPYCDPDNVACNTATDFTFSGRTRSLDMSLAEGSRRSEPFCISIDELDPNPLVAEPYPSFWRNHQGKTPNWFVQVKLTDNPSNAFAIRRSSLRNGRLPYFELVRLAQTQNGNKASPLNVKCCADDPVNTPVWAQATCPTTARLSMSGEVPNATECSGQLCSISGQYCLPNAPGSSSDGKRCCPRGGRLLWRDGAAPCTDYDRETGGSRRVIPDATSCHNWDCTINGQYCPSNRPGSRDGGFTCCNRRWKHGRHSC